MRRPSGRGDRAVPSLLASGVLATAALLALQLGGASAAAVQAAFTALVGVAVVLIFAGSRVRSRERAIWPVVGAAMTFNALCEIGSGWSRIANSGRSSSQKGGQSPSYEDWTKDDLEQRAGEIGIEGRSNMSKDELIRALRNH